MVTRIFTTPIECCSESRDPEHGTFVIPLIKSSNPTVIVLIVLSFEREFQKRSKHRVAKGILMR
jgi:hypothetical protein